MNRRRKSLSNPRKAAFDRQGGCCCYCYQPMWIENPADFGRRFHLSNSQVLLLRCTGEHLHPWKDGGSNSSENIAAACHYCNQRRHRRANELDPSTYKALVQRRLSARRWHGVVLINADAPPNAAATNPSHSRCHSA